MTKECVSWNFLNSKKVQFLERNSLSYFFIDIFSIVYYMSLNHVSKNKILCLHLKNTTWFSSRIDLKENEVICLFLGTNSILKRKAPVTVCFSQHSTNERSTLQQPLIARKGWGLVGISSCAGQTQGT